jgi:hypothetical protein
MSFTLSIAVLCFSAYLSLSLSLLIITIYSLSVFSLCLCLSSPLKTSVLCDSLSLSVFVSLSGFVCLSVSLSVLIYVASRVAHNSAPINKQLTRYLPHNRPEKRSSNSPLAKRMILCIILQSIFHFKMLLMLIITILSIYIS